MCLLTNSCSFWACASCVHRLENYFCAISVAFLQWLSQQYNANNVCTYSTIFFFGGWFVYWKNLRTYTHTSELAYYTNLWGDAIRRWSEWHFNELIKCSMFVVCSTFNCLELFVKFCFHFEKFTVTSITWKQNHKTPCNACSIPMRAASIIEKVRNWRTKCWRSKSWRARVIFGCS